MVFVTMFLVFNVDGVVFNCDTVCYPINEVKIVMESVIDSLIAVDPERFSKKEILEMLGKQRGQHEVIFLKAKVGPVGSCGENKVCKGFRCKETKSGWCSGMFRVYGNRTLIFVSSTSDDVTKTALAHEFIHFFGFLVDKNSDPKHKDKKLWPWACNKKDEDCRKNSALYMANKIAKERALNE